VTVHAESAYELGAFTGGSYRAASTTVSKERVDA